MNEIQVTIRGNVTSDPRQVEFDDGNTLTSFRLASNSRRYDYGNREWINTGTTFVNVNCRRGMAGNVSKSLAKGQPVIVTGKLRERSWEKNGRSGRSLELEADGLGHDLAWGTSEFARIVRTEHVRAVEDEQNARMAADLAEDEEQERIEAALGGDGLGDDAFGSLGSLGDALHLGDDGDESDGHGGLSNHSDEAELRGTPLSAVG